MDATSLRENLAIGLSPFATSDSLTSQGGSFVPGEHRGSILTRFTALRLLVIDKTSVLISDAVLCPLHSLLGSLARRNNDSIRRPRRGLRRPCRRGVRPARRRCDDGSDTTWRCRRSRCAKKD